MVLDQLTVPPTVAAAAAAAIVTVAAGTYLTRRARRRRLGYIGIRNQRIQREQVRARRGGPAARIRTTLHTRGYDAEPELIAAATVAGALITSVTLQLLGVPATIALLAAFPVATLLVVSTLRWLRTRRRVRAGKQILQLLRNVISYLEAGNTPAQSFAKAAALVANPLRTDVQAALSSQVASTGLGAALAPLRDKYPTAATRLLVAALEVNDLVGAKLVPTLRQAEELTRRNIELGAEARAELSQARGEFIGISAVIATIGIVLVAGGGSYAKDAYASPAGVALITTGVVNYAFGVWRTLDVFRRAEEGDE